MDPADWAARFVPRVEEMPMSAPAYDDRPVVSVPRIACAIGERMGCRCITEQGTRYNLDQFKCLRLVQEGGIYDPFREPVQETIQYQPREDSGGGGSAPTVTASPATGVGDASDLQASDGAFRG